MRYLFYRCVRNLKLENGIKSYKLGKNDYLYFWYANNKGKGSNNCTIIRSGSKIRAKISKDQKDVIVKVITSAWRGNVNFSKAVKMELGLTD